MLSQKNLGGEELKSGYTVMLIRNGYLLLSNVHLFCLYLVCSVLGVCDWVDVTYSVYNVYFNSMVIACNGPYNRLVCDELSCGRFNNETKHIVSTFTFMNCRNFTVAGLCYYTSYNI